MSININEVNIPINPEKRDPFYGRNKSDIGLSRVSNMGFDDVSRSILANVKNEINEGSSYNFERFATIEEPILANIVKLKPNSAMTTIHFSLGTWSDKASFISKDVATLHIRSNRNNVSYELFITEPYPKTPDVEGRTNTYTPLSSTQVILKEFNTGGWLVSLKITDINIDSIWVNLVESRNVDIQNPYVDIYSDSDFDYSRRIEFFCDKSRISSEVEIGNLDVVAKSLNHPVKIKHLSVDPDDYYNSHVNTYSIASKDISNLIGTDGLTKDRTLDSISILTDEVTCKKDQLIPLSVNRLNHQIKFRLTGDCINSSQESSWREAQSDQSNMSAFLDTDPEASNSFPVSISKLTHDIDLSVGRSSYWGSMPESGARDGEGYGIYEFKMGKVNYATFQADSTGRNEFYEFNKDSKSWMMKSDPFKSESKVQSISTLQNTINELNLVIHGLDHDIKVEAVNKSYRKSRGPATDENNLLGDSVPIMSGIKNLTWESGDGIEYEDRRHSYVTGSMNINTFEKSIYQGMDLTVHGMDHKIRFRGYRMDTNVLTGPVNTEASDKYRPNSGGRDIEGDIEIDTFTHRVQNFKMQVIDSRYADCARGLAIKAEDNYLPYTEIDDNGDYGKFISSPLSSDEILDIYPTINGIPFTGDFRHLVKYPPEMEADGISKVHSTRNITIPTLHKNSGLDGAGAHKWEVLSSLRVASYNSSGNPVARLLEGNSLDSMTEVENEFGLVRLTPIGSVSENESPSRNLSSLINSLGNDDDVISVKALKSLLSVMVERFEKLELTLGIS